MTWRQPSRRKASGGVSEWTARDLFAVAFGFGLHHGESRGAEFFVEGEEMFDAFTVAGERGWAVEFVHRGVQGFMGFP